MLRSLPFLSSLSVCSLTLISFLFLCSTAIASADLPPCSLNGVLTNGTCVCIKNSGWTGKTCNTLQLQPAAPLTAADQIYFHPSNGGGWVDNSWGISVLPDDSGHLWHGFMTELEGNCSLSTYSSTSRVLHLTAPAPTGPWTVEGVALAAFAHNPQAVRDRDGAWLLFHIGSAVPAYCNISCAGGKPPSINATCSGKGQGTSVARALTPYGPWERVPYILPNNETNPSALVLANGTIVVTARRWTGGVPIYTAPSWRGPYTLLPLAPVIPVPASASVGDAIDQEEGADATGGHGKGNGDIGDSEGGTALVAFDEDAFLYINALGTYHMITHRQPNGTNCPATGVDSSDCRCAGGHMYATDLRGPWYYDLALVYNCTLVVADADADAVHTVSLHARQRPTMLFPPKEGGVPRCPILYTGASTDKASQYYSSFTMAQEVACL